MRGNWWKFDRGDYVALRGLLVFAVGVSALGPIWDLVAWLRGEPLRWQSTSSVAAPASRETVRGATGVYDNTVTWTFTAPHPGQRVGALLPELWILLVVVLASVTLWRVVGSLQREDPFTQATVRAVRVLGLALLAYVVLGWVVDLVADQWVMADARGTFAWGFNLTPADMALGLVAMFVVALAELFRQGTRLADEVEGLV